MLYDTSELVVRCGDCDRWVNQTVNYRCPYCKRPL